MTTATRPRLVFAGAITIDAIALVGSFPMPDSRQVAHQLAYAGGGPAATAAVAAARLGADVAMVGAVGQDEEGERAVAALRAEGIDPSGVAAVRGRRTGASVILVDAGRGTRAIATRPVPDLELGDTGARLIDAAEWVHADHLGWRSVHDHLARTTAKTRLSVDGGNPIAGFTATGADLYVPTVAALEERFGVLSVDDLLVRAVGDGARVVVATRGAAGSIALDAEGARHEAPGHPVDVISTLGAGDVFHGALLAALAGGLPISAALPYANVAAALSCRGLDGRSAIPTDAEVRAVLDGPAPAPPRPAEEAR
ncbi:carbohydrate kinase family protein [Georgenia alba]|uniref:Carbohydrate kinase family protein n=1 Tax=Georgenia alba TaxID=2233858 RepID=A0ABW2Q6A2_9MICO